MTKVLSIFGTRPEAIKMAKLVKLMEDHPEIDSKICVTGQHKEMLEQVMNQFSIKADYNLDVMRENQTLSSLSAAIFNSLPDVIKSFRPDCILVHGDTTTSFCAALTAFYQRVPIGHVEAGLRTGNLAAPWPEEANRKMTASIADWHFAPTDLARKNLLAESIDPKKITVTGNTVIDSLLYASDLIEKNDDLGARLSTRFQEIPLDSQMVLITGHRRENFGDGFEQICNAIQDLSTSFPGVEFVYPVHLNPVVKDHVHSKLKGRANIHLIEPVQYFEFVYLMKKSSLIMTDSGGVQEEAPSLGKPVVVLRETTERPEAIAAKTATLVGSNRTKIVSVVSKLIKQAPQVGEQLVNPYGDGHASERIVSKIIERA